MGRKMKHRDRCLSRVRLPGELVDRLDASLADRESRADALEEAVRKEVERREEQREVSDD